MYRVMLLAVILGMSGLSSVASADVAAGAKTLAAPGVMAPNAASDSAPCQQPPPTEKARIQQSFGRLPLYFIENQGQLDEEVAFYIQGDDKTLYFAPDGVTFSLHGESGERWNVRMSFAGARADVSPQGQDKQQAVFSYFKGKPEDWKAGVPTYSKVVYENLWPGIDLVYSGTVNKLKYDFIVKPGADPSKIRFNLSGASAAALDDSGILRIQTPQGGFQDDKPTAYQQSDKGRREVSVAYSLEQSEQEGFYSLSFDVGAYDAQKELVIDPVVLVYCGYLGGSDLSYPLAVAVDKWGNAYVTGYIEFYKDCHSNGGKEIRQSSDNDIFVAKVTASGEKLDYFCYIGGTNYEEADDIAVDKQGNAYITGYAYSSESDNFPVIKGPDLTHNGLSDVFVAKLSPSGSSLIFCGYIGGSNYEAGSSIDVDQHGNAYVSGTVQSSENQGFPVAVGPDLTYNDNGDTFVAKIEAAGTHLDYCGYIGGSELDIAKGIAVDAMGNAYVVGHTLSNEKSGFPVIIGPDLTFNSTESGSDAFVAKINTTGNCLDYCGYIGGSGDETSGGIAVDSWGNAYVAGTVDSPDGFPVKIGPDLSFNSSFYDAFVAKIAASGSELAYCGFIGGDYGTSGEGISVDDSGNAYVTGYTGSSEFYGFPVLVGPDLTYNGGGHDGYIAKVAVDGTHLNFCGYIGGWDDDYCLDLALDVLGNAYIVGVTGSDEETFPVKVGPELTKGDSIAFIANVLTKGLFCESYYVSAGSGGTVVFNLTSGAENEGRNYLLLGSATGTEQGIPLPGGHATLPLNWDVFTDIVLAYLNTSLFQNFLGKLDANGEATAQLNAPPLDPIYVGAVLYFAYCLNAPFDFVSNPVPITIVP